MTQTTNNSVNMLIYILWAYGCTQGQPPGSTEAYIWRLYN